MDKYHTLIIGATFFGGAVALGNSEKTIIVERTNLVGREFVDSLNEKTCKKINIKSKLGNKLYRKLLESKSIDDEGNIFSFAAVVELARMFLESCVKVLFLTEITEIKKVDDGFIVTLFNQEGKKTIFAENILDTTAERILKEPSIKSWTKKYLNVVAEGENLIMNPLTGKSYLRFPVDIDEDIISARYRLYTHLKETDTKPYFVSNSFAYEMPAVKVEIENGYLLVPSCGYYNLLEAFDEGGLFYE